MELLNGKSSNIERKIPYVTDSYKAHALNRKIWLSGKHYLGFTTVIVVPVPLHFDEGATKKKDALF